MDKKLRKERKQLIHTIALRLARSAIVKGLKENRTDIVGIEDREITKYAVLLFAEQRMRFLEMAEEHLRSILKA